MLPAERIECPRAHPGRRVACWAMVVVGVLAVAAAVWFKPITAPLLVLAVSGAIALIAWPEMATPAVLFLLYTNAPVVAVRFHRLPYALGAAVPLVLAAPLAYYLFLKRRQIVIDRAVPWILALAAVQFVSAAFSQFTSIALPTVLETVIEGFCLYFLVVNVVRTPETLRRATWALLLAGAFLGALSGYQQLTKTFSNNYGGFAQMSNAAFHTGQGDSHGEVYQRRLCGPLDDQNRYAQIMLMLIPLGLFRFWSERSRLLKLAAMAATGLAGVGMTLTFSRGAAVAFALLLLIVVVLRYISLAQFGAMIAGALVLLLVFPQFTARFAALARLGQGEGVQSTDGAVRGRYTETVAALLMYGDHLLLGVGPGVYPQYYRAYAEMVGIRVQDELRKPHTLYLGIAAENGTPGILLFLLIALVVVRDLVRARRLCGSLRPDLAAMTTAFLLAILAYHATGLFLHFSYVRYYWLILAMGSAAACIAQEAIGRGASSDVRIRQRSDGANGRPPQKEPVFA